VEQDRASAVQPHLHELGRPLTTREVTVELIAATTTRPGPRVRAELDPGRYPQGVKVSDWELAAVPLRRHDWHGEWSYTVLSTAAWGSQEARSCWVAPVRTAPGGARSRHDYLGQTVVGRPGLVTESLAVRQGGFGGDP
jgi:hypothetical protein